jgi:phosphoglycerol transferase MdoB-like AlkP superfamily enzyme
MADNVPTVTETAAPRTPWRQSRYAFAALVFVTLLVVHSAFRVFLFARFRPDGELAFGDLLRALMIGLHRDFFIALLFSLPLLGWFVLVPNRWFGRWWHRALFTCGTLVWWLVQIYLLFTEYFFFEEFRSRFNTVAVDYLLYPHEVFVNIWESYPVVKVLLACVGFSVAWTFAALRWCGAMWATPVPRRERFAVLGGALAACIVLAPTVSLRGARFSEERLFNEFSNNGPLAFIGAAWTRHLDFNAFYKTLPMDDAYARARKLLKEPHTEFVGDEKSIRRKVAGDPARPKLNAVIILEESLGSEFWGSLGRTNGTCTPEMDKLALTEGMFFTNIFATGNRTVRGFEGVLSSFPPLPGDSIVKRDLSENVESVARVLKRDDYATVFLYGGRGVFDGMRSYAVNNGYDRFIEQKHIENPSFTTIWGVADEDLFKRAVTEFRELNAAGKPFFGTVLSVSNHKPYTYPKGRIASDPDARKREHAVEYSDWCLGEFFRAAKREAFWTNTVFVMVADHGARVYGSQSIPIHSYEIPLVILGPAAVKAPTIVPHLGCSMDVAPTMLGLIGRPYETMFFGRDLLRSPPAGNLALLNHNRDIGIYQRERLIVYGMRKGIEYYEGDPKKVDMKHMAKPGEPEFELERNGISLFQVADELYISRRYAIDGK